jgi:hypothetical protein
MKVLHVEKVISDKDMKDFQNTFVERNKIHTILDEDADVFTKDGRLLLRFRKKKIDNKLSDEFFDNTYDFTRKNTSKNRGSTSGSTTKNINENKPVMSSILGYFDKWAPNHKADFKRLNMKYPIEVRETMFSTQNPDKFKKIVPFIQRINTLYKQLIPENFKKQNKKAKQTEFKIPKTAFTTITTNVNFQTSIHTDKGDDAEGFGNLSVIEKGRYKGAETCLPQYGVGANVREGDILFMDVHEWHGNLPIEKIDEDAIRMSVVCYLRKNVWARTKGKPRSFKEKHLKTLKNIKNKAKKNKNKQTKKKGKKGKK